MFIRARRILFIIIKQFVVLVIFLFDIINFEFRNVFLNFEIINKIFVVIQLFDYFINYRNSINDDF